jgi:alpha-L-fucosidase
VFVQMWPHPRKVLGELGICVHTQRNNTSCDTCKCYLFTMSKWMAVNSECIYGTRPWAIYGEGPSVKNDATAVDAAVNPPRGLGPNLTASDIRFTTKGDVLYAVAMGRPDAGKIGIKALASNSPHYPGGIGRVQLLGSSAKLEFSRDETGLTVTIPDSAASDYATALKIR